MSPYASPDSFAGNHYLIDIEALDTEGVLSKADYDKLMDKQPDRYREHKDRALVKIYQSWIASQDNQAALLRFMEQNAWWLDNHLAYHAEKAKEAVQSRSFDGRYRAFLQYIFARQYKKIKEYANSHGIVIFGDLPFYVSADSADVLANRNYFLLDKKDQPLYQSAVPPDAFQENGQLWGTPVYDWDALEKDNFSYWLKKIERQAEFFDYLRIDHFRGLQAYYRVPADASDARDGEWINVPGDALLGVITKVKGITLIAENLGHITDEVDYLLEKHQIPGMKIMQFAKNDLYAYKDKKDTVYYSGTHDNQTLSGWITHQFEVGKRVEKEVCWDLLKKLYASRANWVIVPLQDALCLDEQARMNTPGTTEHNWVWTFDGDWSELETAGKKLGSLALSYQRD